MSELTDLLEDVDYIQDAFSKLKGRRLSSHQLGKNITPLEVRTDFVIVEINDHSDWHSMDFTYTGFMPYHIDHIFYLRTEKNLSFSEAKKNTKKK